MRLAIVSLMGGMQWGGSEALWFALAKFARSKEDEVFVSVYQWPEVNENIKELEAKGVKVFFRKRYNPNPKSIGKITRFLKNRQPALNEDYTSIINFKPDHVFISQGATFDLAQHHFPLFKLMSSRQITYSIVCHSSPQYSYLISGDLLSKAQKVFHRATQIFFVSKKQQNITRRVLLSKMPNSLITWNPLNLQQIPTEPLPYPVTKNINMAIVGAVVSGKGHDTLFEIFSEPKWKARNFRLNIYGTGEGEYYLKQLSEYYQLEEKIIFHGHVTDINELWLSNNILLFPSSGEGMPISLVEAMACGRCAVVTDVGGMSEIIENDKTGFVAEAPSKYSFDRALEKAWVDKKNWREKGVAAFNFINSILDSNPEKRIYNLLSEKI